MLVKIENNTNKIKMLGIPTRLSETPGEIRLFPPSIGEHTDEILTDLGLSDEEIKDFRKKNL